MFFTKRQ